jgi:uncharacterized protein (TIGR02001 family)
MSMILRGVFAASLLTGSVLATPAFAQDETAPPSEISVNASVSLVTDYRFRGLSRSSGDAAIQGGATVSHASGVYAGLWSSSTSFEVVGPAAERVYGGQELDLYGGWSGPVGGFPANTGFLYYAFPGGHVGKAEFFEPYASLSGTLGPVTAKIGANYAWRQQALNFNGGRNDDNVYIYGELGGGVPNTPVSLSAHLGYTDGALSPKYATGETLDYRGGLDWSLGAIYAITRNLSVGAQYVGVQGRSIDGYSNDTVVGTLKLSF